MATNLKITDLKPRSTLVAQLEDATAVTAERFTVRKTAGLFGHLWRDVPKVVAPVTAGALALLSQWDHHMENLRWKHLFEEELASKTGKPVEALKIKDFEKVGDENPVLHEALARSRAKRNVSVVAVVLGTAAATVAGALVGTASIGAALVAAPVIGGVIAGIASAGLALGLASSATAAAAGIGTFIAGAAASAVGFMTVETVTEKVGERKLGLDEPSMSKVERHPEKQAQMSVPNQIALLTRKQNRREAITREQVMQVFASANPVLAAEIESRFGEPFNKLSPATKDRVLEKIGPQYNIEELTNDLNNRHMRAQELAFTVAGQESGVPRLESGDLKKLQAAYQDPKAHHHAAGSRLAFLHSKISGFIPGKQKQAAAPAAPSSPVVAAAEKIARDARAAADAEPPAGWREKEIARRQQAAAAAGIA